MRYRLLGPLEAVGAAGPVELGAPKKRTLLALLLVERNRVVPAARLHTELWPDEAPPAAAHTLQAYVSELRRALREAEPGHDALETAPGGYRLVVEDGACDVDEVSRLAARARVLRPEDPRAAAAQLQRALELWRGDALAGTQGPAVDAEARLLEEQRLALTEELLDARLAAGDAAAVAGEAELLVERSPLRERLHGLLALALYRSGRQADALASLRRVRRLLADELGVDPSPELRSLEASILGQDRSLDASADRSPRVRYARNGTTSLAYTVTGDGPLDVVLSPGLICHLEVERERGEYVAFLDRLARRCRLVVFDKRGMGLSDRFDGVASLEQRADDLRAVLDAAGVERAVLLGFSEGGLLAATLAATAPERVRAIAFLSSCARFRRRDGDEVGYTDERAQAVFFDYVDTAWGSGRWGQASVPSQAHDDDFVRWFGRFERSATSPGTMRQLLEMDRDADVRPLLAQLDLPALVVHRTGDRVLPVEHGRQLAALLPQARYVELPGSDHTPWFGDAEPYLAAIERWLDELS